MRVIASTASVRGLPLGRSLILAAMAVLLMMVDVLPDNHFVDSDVIEFWLALGLGAAAVVLAVRDRGLDVDWIAWRNRAILLTITLAFSALGAEYVTRFVFRSVTTSSDNGGYFSRRWYRVGEVHQNAMGFRGRAFDPVKPDGIYRIAAVGDSFTFGNGIPAEDRYSEVLQAHLPSHFEVLNFGVAGANTPEHRLLVQRLLRDVHPDFILLQWYVNDVEDDDSTARPRSRALIPYRPLHNWLNNTSALYTIMNMQWAETQVALRMTESYPDYLKARLGDPQSANAIRDQSLLRDLIASAQQAKVGIGIVLFPDTASELDARYPFGYLHDRVLAMCAERNITCVDLRSDFATVRDRQSLWASRLDHHPSARANAIAAERILETYSTQWTRN
jgi:hypothetical protein